MLRRKKLLDVWKFACQKGYSRKIAENGRKVSNNEITGQVLEQTIREEARAKGKEFFTDTYEAILALVETRGRQQFQRY